MIDRSQKVWLARDRYGIKPLYYTLTDEGTFLFGSEIKSILEYLPERPAVDLAALNEYFSFQNIFSDCTLFSGITLLPPGHYLELDLSNVALNPDLIGRKISKTRYWDFDFGQETDVPINTSLKTNSIRPIDTSC